MRFIATLPNLYAFVVCQSVLKLLSKSIQEIVHIIGSFEIRRFHDLRWLNDSLLPHYRNRFRRPFRAVAFRLLLLGHCALDATDSNVEFLQCLALGLGDVSEALLFLCPLSQGCERRQASRPQASFTLGSFEILI